MTFLIVSIIKAAVVAFVLLTALAYLQWLERKVLAHIQLRVGPRRVGPHGLLQPLADVVKLITKEDMMPSHVNKVFWFMAPFIAVMFALIPIAVIPFGTELSLPAINLGPVHIPAAASDRDAVNGPEYRRSVHPGDFWFGCVRRGTGGDGLRIINIRYWAVCGVRRKDDQRYELPMAKLAIAG